MGRRMVIGKKEASAGYFLLSGRSLKFGDEMAGREMRVAEDLRNAQNASRGRRLLRSELVPIPQRCVSSVPARSLC